MSEQQATPKTVDSYITGFPALVQARLRKMRATIKRAAPGAKETISYGIPTLKLNGPLIYFAGFKSHIGIYPMTTTIRKQFKKELSPYLSGKGTAKFPLDQPMPYTLITQIVKFRVKENLAETNRTES
ncbi:MAG: hypothetical protein HOP00_04800 [Nitrospira sp.]|nr:hypothetical protein [Nitrospira sp.]